MGMQVAGSSNRVRGYLLYPYLTVRQPSVGPRMYADCRSCIFRTSMLQYTSPGGEKNVTIYYIQCTRKSVFKIYSYVRVPIPPGRVRSTYPGPGAALGKYPMYVLFFLHPRPPGR